MNNVTMKFGGRVGQAQIEEGIQYITGGFLGGENLDSITLDVIEHQMYILLTREITISSGALRGFRAIQIARTETDSFNRQNLAASTNAGVTITNNTSDGTITLTPSSTSYDVYYVLYSVM